MFPKEPDRLIGVDSFQDIHVKITQIHTQTGVILLHIRKYNMRTASIKNIITTVLRNIHSTLNNWGFPVNKWKDSLFFIFLKTKAIKIFKCRKHSKQGNMFGLFQKDEKKIMIYTHYMVSAIAVCKKKVWWKSGHKYSTEIQNIYNSIFNSLWFHSCTKSGTQEQLGILWTFVTRSRNGDVQRGMMCTWLQRMAVINLSWCLLINAASGQLLQACQH